MNRHRKNKRTTMPTCPGGSRTAPTILLLTLILFVAVFATSCLDWSDEASPALRDNDDTTGEVWTDSTSGLMWQVTPTGGDLTWSSAKSYCAGLGYGGHSDWRLPTISELRSLIRGCAATETGGSCGVKDSCLDSLCWDDSCDGCSDGGGPADGCYWPSQMDGTCGWYWSSSAVADDGGYAWDVYFDYGAVDNYGDDGGDYARCVR